MKRVILLVVCVVVLAFAGAAVFLITHADDFIEKYRHDIAGLAIQLEDIEISWLTYSVVLKKVNIYPAGKERRRYRLASADELRVSLAPDGLFRKTIHVRKLTLIRPKFRYIRTSMRHTNWEALNMSWLKKEQTDKSTLGGWRLRVDEVKIENGIFNFRDRVSGGHIELRSMDAKVSNIVDEPNPRRLPSRVTMDAKLSKYNSPVTLRGRMNLLSEGLNFKFNSHIQNAPITYFSQFYAGQVPFKIIAGRISVKSNARALKSYLNSTHHAAISRLKVGGIHGKIINPLFLKKKVIYATAHVNGDLESGKLRVSSQVSRIIGNSILSDAKKASPIHSIGRGIKRAGQKTGNAIRNLFRRR